MNQRDNQLQLDVKDFCSDVIAGVRDWQKTGPDIPFANLLSIEVIDTSKGFTL